MSIIELKVNGHWKNKNEIERLVIDVERKYNILLMELGEAAIYLLDSDVDRRITASRSARKLIERMK